MACVANIRFKQGFIFSGMGHTKRQAVLSSVWELTLSERQNAALILENTTVRPFTFCRYFFKCFFCEQNYPEVHSLLTHSEEHKMPDKDTILKELLRKGKKTVKVDISGLTCKLCSNAFSNLEEIRSHLSLTHNKVFTQSGIGLMAYDLSLKDRQFSCHICEKGFQTFILLNRHMNVHFSNAVCDTCGAGFMTYQRLMQHKETHSPNGYPCHKCKKVYTTNSNLKYHIEKVHERDKNVKLLRCPHCPERFSEHFRKLKHLKDVHGITFSFDCDVCKSKFPTRRALTTHTNKLHTDKTQCSICKKCFSCLTTLRKHIESHTGDRNFVCGICQKAYRQEKSLRRHLSAHVHNLNKVTCLECGNEFSSRNDFNVHAKEWHAGVIGVARE